MNNFSRIEQSLYFMKNIKTILVTVVVNLLFISVFSQIKVACVGNSITEGAGIVNRDKNTYPAQLQYWLGDKYEVKNFGKSGRTLLLKGDYPYVNEIIYQQSLSFNPNIVLIKLGTNDIKKQNRIYLEESYYNDYKQLINSYKALESNPRIILLTPVFCYLDEGVWAKCDSVFQAVVLPTIYRLSKEMNLEVIDLYNLFSKDWQWHIMPDKLHPSSIGAGIMAKKIAYKIEPIEQNLCTFPLPGNEFRTGAGWQEGCDWHCVADEIADSIHHKKLDLLMIGNSITQGFGGICTKTNYRPGELAMKDCGFSWANAGISGDKTQNVLWRILNHNYESAEVKNITLTIGVNNFREYSAQEISEGIIVCAKEIAEKFPNSSIWLFGTLPVGKDRNGEYRLKYNDIKEIITNTKFPRNVKFISTEKIFMDKNQELKPELFADDFLHLSAKGYEEWAKEIIKLVKD